MGKRPRPPQIIPQWLKQIVGLGVGNWQLVVAVLTTVGLGGWSYLHHHGYLETAVLCLWTFVGILLAIGGVLWLRDRREPRQIRVEHDLPWGLAYQGATAHADPLQPDMFFQIGLVFQNVSAHTLEMLVTRFDVVVGSRTLGKSDFEHKPLIVPRHTTRTYRHPPFPRDSLVEYIGQNRTEGVAEFWVNYGPVGEPKTRCLHVKLDLYLRIDLAGSVGFSEIIALEKDSEVHPE